MPVKALVAFGVLLILGLSSPALSLRFDAGASEQPTDMNQAAPNAAQSLPNQETVAVAALSHQQALELTLRHNPALSAAQAELKAREQEQALAALAPSPEISFELDNLTGSGAFSGGQSLETTLRVSRLLELGGKRALREALGSLEAEAGRYQYEVEHARALAQVGERFAAVLASTRSLELAGEQLNHARKMLATAEDRIAAGKAALVEKIRFQSLVSEARLVQSRARQQLDVARQTLAASWGGNAADFGALEGNLEELPSVPEWETLQGAFETVPEIALKGNALQMADQTLALERAGRLPDLTLGIGGRHDRETGGSALVAEVSFPLTFSGANRKRVEAARLRKEAARDEIRAAQLQLRSEALSLWSVLRGDCAEAGMLRDEILPAAKQSFEASSYGYQVGKFGVLEVLEAQRNLFESRHRYNEVLLSARRNLSALDGLLGPLSAAAEASVISTEIKRGPL